MGFSPFHDQVVSLFVAFHRDRIVWIWTRCKTVYGSFGEQKLVGQVFLLSKNLFSFLSKGIGELIVLLGTSKGSGHLQLFVVTSIGHRNMTANHGVDKVQWTTRQ